VKVKLYTFRLQVASLLRHASFNKSLLLNSRNRFVNSNNCFSLADLRLFALQEADVSAAWKNNGLGSGFASYSHFCDYYSFVNFSSDSRVFVRHSYGMVSIITLIHVPLGITAVSFGVWFVIAWRYHGLKGCFNRKKLMLATMITWLVSLFFGILLYSIFYWSLLFG
jgi:hypothetical protein